MHLLHIIILHILKKEREKNIRIYKNAKFHKKEIECHHEPSAQGAQSGTLNEPSLVKQGVSCTKNLSS